MDQEPPIILAYDRRTQNGTFIPNGMPPMFWRDDYDRIHSHNPDDRDKDNWFCPLIDSFSVDHIRNLGIRKATVEEIHDKDYPWFYLLGTICGTYEWFLNAENHERNDYTFPLKYTSKEALEGIIDRNGWLLITCLQEGNELESKFFDLLYKMLDHYKIPKHKVILITGNLLASDNYKKYCETKNIKEEINVRGFNHFEYTLKRAYFYHSDSPVLDRESFDRYKNTKRPKRFLCFNRLPKKHRWATLLSIEKYSLFDKSLVSYCNGTEFKSWIESSKKRIKIISKIREDGLSDYTEDVEQRFPLKVDSDDLSFNHAFDKNWLWPYWATYFSLVTETLCDDDSLFLTEKTFKPIAQLHPFVIIGNKWSIAQLKELGYETLDIDHSYDGIEDWYDRIKSAMGVVSDMCKWSDSYMYDWYRDQFDRLVYNRNLLESRDCDPNIRSFLSETVGGLG